MRGIPVTNVDELRKLASKDGGEDFYIGLKGGVRSSKHISYADGTFYITNEIDDSEQELNEAELMDRSETHIGEAIEKNSFYRYEY